MSGEITNIIFDREVFPLSPHMSCYEAYQQGSRIIFYAAGAKDLFNQYATQLNADQACHHTGLPDGQYTLMVTMEGPHDRPQAVFRFRDNNTQEVLDQVQMPHADFVEEYARVFVAKFAPDLMGRSREPSQEHADFELNWSVDYLKNKIFNGRLNATDAFWTEFYGQYDVATAPINIRMEVGPNVEIISEFKTDLS